MGARSGIVRDGLRTTVNVTAYPFVKVMNGFENATNQAFDFVFSYDSLRRDHAGLQRELAAMKLAIHEKQELRAENVRLRRMLGYVRTQPRLALEPVRVLENFKGMLRIDRGSMHGIHPSMSVIAPEGVVGVVIETSPFTSVVATLHHVDCRVGAMVLRNRIRAYDGIVHASGSDLSRICTMEYIDLKDDVRVGDLVVTTPESLFPSGYPIGTVSAVHGSGSLWRTAEITPAVDPYSLDEVFVVRRETAAVEDLEGPLDLPEGPVPGVDAPLLPEEVDLRTIQERFAP